MITTARASSRANARDLSIRSCSHKF